jgi:hypothetical protein
MKSMRELRPRKMVTLVKRYIDTFSPQELDIIAAYIDDKIENAPWRALDLSKMRKSLPLK